MMKKIIFILALTILGGIIILNIASHLPIYSAATKNKTCKIMTNKQNDTIKIAFIGDSWAYLHSIHKCYIDTIIYSRSRLNTKIRSVGFNGITSKEVYQSLFSNDSIINLLEWAPNYCIISAGINDTDYKYGKFYYAKNIELIIEFMLDSNITPIILQIPHYDINYTFEKRYKRQKLQRLLSMIITDSEMDCIDSYRIEFEKALSKYHGKIIYIKGNEWNPKGYQDPRIIYTKDKMHLNEKGYSILDSCIADHINNHLSQTSTKKDRN